MFTDNVAITVQAGNGGHGCVSWRREKYVPNGGPDGGDGGHGGSIIFRAAANTDTLSDFSSTKRFLAENGHPGSGGRCAGKDGKELLLNVPIGTVITDVTDPTHPQFVADLNNEGKSIVVVEGGIGGKGNVCFVNSIRQRPDFAELGEPGEQKILKLELKLIADIGIIGYPNVGKSTLISRVSAARPKIADYAFTTLTPNLGVVKHHDRSFVLCDIPGLIEGASEGKGLGHDFLRHIERCGALLHVLDLSRALRVGSEIDLQQIIDDYQAIRRELERFSPLLSTKDEIVILHKADLVPDVDGIVKSLRLKKVKVALAVSSVTGLHVRELLDLLSSTVERERTERRPQERTAEERTNTTPILRPGDDDVHKKMSDYRLDRKDDGSLLVHGRRIEQFTVMTDFTKEGGRERFRNVLKVIGLLNALKKQRTKGEAIYIGSHRIDEYLEEA